MSSMAKRLYGIKMLLGVEVGLGPGDTVLDEDPAPPTERGTAAPPPLFGPCLLWTNGRSSQLLLSSCTIVLQCCDTISLMMGRTFSL